MAANQKGVQPRNRIPGTLFWTLRGKNVLMMPLGLMDLLLGTGPESTLFQTEKVNVNVIVTVNVSCLSSVIMFIVLFFIFVTGV